MRNIIILLTVAIALTLLVAISCTDRGANYSDPIPSSSGGALIYSSQFNELFVQIGKQQLFHIAIYIPNGDLQQAPLPLVLLLPPQGGDEMYYYNHGLKQLADKLIADETIVPMAIACIKSDQIFGGYFWAGNYGGGSGDYDQIMGSALLDNFVKKNAGLILADDPSKCGIGGVGTGAYGALRAALLNDHRFSSVTVTDGPLDFDGADGNGGWIDMFDDVLIEQGLLNYVTDPPVIDTTYYLYKRDTSYTTDIDSINCDTIEVDSIVCDTTYEIDTITIDSSRATITIFPPGDYSIIDTTYDDSWTDLFDSSHVNQLSRIFIGGSIAFSPNDTLCKARELYGQVYSFPPTYIPVIDTFIYVISYDPYETDTILTPVRYQIDDTVTLCTEIVKSDNWDFEFHLPFDSTGEPYPLIWDMWLRNNLETILSDSGNSRLDDVNMWIGTSTEQALSYREQTMSWIDHLEGQGFHPEVYEYSGYDGHPATGDQYIYELMEKMLIFHSRNFEEADAAKNASTDKTAEEIK